MSFRVNFSFKFNQQTLGRPTGFTNQLLKNSSSRLEMFFFESLFGLMNKDKKKKKKVLGDFGYAVYLRLLKRKRKETKNLSKYQ